MSVYSRVWGSGEASGFDLRAAIVPESDLGEPLLCLLCGSANVHPHRVEVDRGGDVCVVEPDGVGFTTRQHHARGAIIALDWFCESGHRFRTQFQFHKGSSYLRVTQQLPVAEREPWPATLWRD